LQPCHLAVGIAAETEIAYMSLYIPQFFYPQMKSQANKFYGGTAAPSEEVVGEGGEEVAEGEVGGGVGGG
jgi:uncharacterized membrane protein